MSYKLEQGKVRFVGKIIFILIFFRLIFWIKSSTTIVIFVSTIIYKLFRKPRKAFAYPEIHYVLARRLSLIYRHYPEVITDAPWRLKRGKPIPILCIIKDADEFPAQLLDITVCIEGDDFSSEIPLQYPDDRIMRVISNLDPGRSITPKKGLIDSKYWYTLGYISIPEDYVGWLDISPKIRLISEKRSFFRHNKILNLFSSLNYTKGRDCDENMVQRTIFTDNLPMLSHAPLQIYVSKDDLPHFDNWYYGDAHCHSDRTDNQTEFGAPLIAFRAMGKSIGLKWTAITDHSFDLDVPVNEFYGRDPKRTRWKSLTAEIELTNSLLNDFFLMRGEEISCGNANEENIHLLAYGVSEFIPGRGDGCKDRDNIFDFTNLPDIALTTALKKINKNDGLAFAAHPYANSHRLAKFFINRGIWEDEDCKFEECLGLQIWDSCGTIDTFEGGYKRWINLLLNGYKKYIIAGSDSHGDFNRYRYVKHPFIKLKERMNSYFGKPRTCVYCASVVNEESVLEAFRKGRAVVTDGPLAIFELVRDDGKRAVLGETVSGKRFDLMLRIRSTEEFGELQQAVIYKGELSKKREVVLAKIDLKHANDRYFHVSRHPIIFEEHDDLLSSLNMSLRARSRGTKQTNLYSDENIESVIADNGCYIRVEAMSKRKDESYRCITNPIWVMSNK